MKNIYNFFVLAFMFFAVSTMAQEITISPSSIDLGATNIEVTITGTGTSFIPGTTVCAEVSNGSGTFSIGGSAFSATDFTGTVSIPIFAQTGSYDVTIFQGPGCGGISWNCVDCLNICSAKTILGTPVPASCFGCNDGAVDVVLFGGSPPYTFTWSNGATTQNISGLTAGIYSVSINDMLACESIESYNVTQPEPITLSPDKGFSGNTEIFTITGTGTEFLPGSTSCGEIVNGIQTYQFTGVATSSTNFNASFDIPPGAVSGVYDVILYTDPGCTGTIWGCSNCYTVCVPVQITGDVSNATCVGCQNGSIDITTSGGTPPFTYLWSNGTTQEDALGIFAGTYTVSVTDLLNCETQASFQVLEPEPISVIPASGDPGSSSNISIIGSVTTFIPGTTSCVELTDGLGTYSFTGLATSATLFNGTFDIPFLAPPGFYDVTIYEGPDCGGTAWSCTNCYTINSPFTCGGSFFDNGGPTENYLNSSSENVTICPGFPNGVVSINFSSFSLENNGSDCIDELIIFDGDDTSDPIIQSPGGTTQGWCWDRADPTPGGSGDLMGQTITSTDISGCLTFVFNSDPANSRIGWDASISCNDRITIAPLNATAGETIVSTIVGVGTDFMPGTTTCAEFTNGATTVVASGSALSTSQFSGTATFPSNAAAGLYDVTVYQGPGCTGSSFASTAWTCTGCFELFGGGLPIEWLSFTATNQQNDILLNWATATELNSMSFEVEKSANGQNWRSIHSVAATGTSQILTEYKYLDRNPLIGKNYYRIKQLDNDNRFSYSEVKVVLVKNDFGVLTVKPNPAVNNTSVFITSEIEENVMLVITDLSGRLMNEMQVKLVKGYNNIDLNLTGYRNGIYLIKINGYQPWDPIKLLKM